MSRSGGSGGSTGEPVEVDTAPTAPFMSPSALSAFGAEEAADSELLCEASGCGATPRLPPDVISLQRTFGHSVCPPEYPEWGRLKMEGRALPWEHRIVNPTRLILKIPQLYLAHPTLASLRTKLAM